MMRGGAAGMRMRVRVRMRVRMWEEHGAHVRLEVAAVEQAAEQGVGGGWVGDVVCREHLDAEGAGCWWR